MKKAFTSCFILLIVITAAIQKTNAQSTEAPKEMLSAQARAQKVLTKIFQRCNTTANQASKINFVYANYFRKFEEYRSTPQGQQNFEMKLRILQNDLNEKMQSILTPDQLCNWTAYLQSEGLED